jgi:hypothetical protein
MQKLNALVKTKMDKVSNLLNKIKEPVALYYKEKLDTLYTDIGQVINQYYPSEISSGDFKIIPFTMNEDKIIKAKMACYYSGHPEEAEGLQPGNYVKLVNEEDEVVMSNTPMEVKTNMAFIKEARGDILIGGLGIGLILKLIENKKEIDSIDVIELESDIINMVKRQVPLSDKINIINSDIFTVKPQRKYDIIYIDIWTFVTAKNYPECKELRRKWKKYLKKNGKILIWRENDFKKLYDKYK